MSEREDWEPGFKCFNSHKVSYQIYGVVDSDSEAATCLKWSARMGPSFSIRVTKYYVPSVPFSTPIPNLSWGFYHAIQEQAAFMHSPAMWFQVLF